MTAAVTLSVFINQQPGPAAGVLFTTHLRLVFHLYSFDPLQSQASGPQGTPRGTFKAPSE